ncbi:bifunctional non-homologous end joining protein LigD [Friedmanniella luteola]|uniref:Bifunctional non-homologous end joining protein LigD n=1 Tax=Friedmanniella luteola TaxID=546871 RepID=A0A1H1VMT1_9ACTN|nr:non-homologous end-joining DNA ligase [Friedmanniella luteola]SDS86112.1 bifunctional non-homologous end joining protein LigD [Friedmanniella luteola]
MAQAEQPARDVTTEVDGRVLGLTNLDKVLYPATGYTKAEVVSYYLQVAPTILPHVRDRAMTRLRYPDGVRYDEPREERGGSTPPPGGAFYEKNAPAGTPPWVPRQRVGTSDGVIDYVVVDEPATLVWLANLAALELHTPQWTISSGTAGADGVLDLPAEEPRPGEPLADRVVVDLDPGAGMSIVETARAALLVAGVMAADGLVPVPQSSGSKGIQVYAAIAPCRSRDAWAYTRRLNATMARSHPDLFVAAMSVEQRRGRIYVDHNQNLAARNTIAPYSLRGRERPSVATPVTWEEVGAVSAPEDLRFSPEDVLARLEEHGDLAADLLDEDRPPLPSAPVG